MTSKAWEGMKIPLDTWLKTAGTKVLDSPTSVYHLLPLLDHVHRLLLMVEQKPIECIQEAITPITSALVSDVLLNHYDLEVKVSVASCISEIIRITAPEAPYGHAKMKDVFRLIFSAFEGLYDDSSRSFLKRVDILLRMSQVSSGLILLDMECDALVVEMFKIFLANIRDYHPSKVFLAMEKIMVAVLKDSEHISSEVLAALLACLKKDNQGILPIAATLAKNVFEKCAAELKPYLSQGTISLDDYTEVVTAVCIGCPAAVEHPNPLVPRNAISMDADQNVSEDETELRRRRTRQFF